ncbi:hypothetical protein F383_31946 [Gossypium arboreum]|uniref:Uncharacterized protein n=1 Tax=Gossypium arboreum TaxID=29729 RepID=A0A0B0N1D3_GOSAR|nr:hypothetical protein F383_31946 [Gossypium arboreum]
MCCRKGFSSDR